MVSSKTMSKPQNNRGKSKIPNQKSFHMCEICTHGRAHHFNSPHGCCNLKFRQKHHLWSKRNWMESYDTMSKPKKKVMNPEFRIKVFLRVWALRIAMIDKLTISVLPTDALHHNNIKYTSTSNWYVVKVIRSLQINMLTVWQRRWTLKGSLGRMVKSPWVLFSKVDQTSAPVYDSRGFLGQTPISSSKMLFKIDFFSRWPLLLS